MRAGCRWRPAGEGMGSGMVCLRSGVWRCEVFVLRRRLGRQQATYGADELGIDPREQTRVDTKLLSVTPKLSWAFHHTRKLVALACARSLAAGEVFLDNPSPFGHRGRLREVSLIVGTQTVWLCRKHAQVCDALVLFLLGNRAPCRFS